MSQNVKIVGFSPFNGKTGVVKSTKFDPDMGMYICTVELTLTKEIITIPKSELKFLKK